ncbi:MAG: hypothetical protein LBT00_15660 [Spirochaetaceae bacterium]|nr:hypothetical protein [Spirochaetaceae bacterium]
MTKGLARNDEAAPSLRGGGNLPLAAKQSSRGRQSPWIASPFGFAMTRGLARNDEGARSQ